jgi:tetratricopeptide (TPR) repeat protein
MSINGKFLSMLLELHNTGSSGVLRVERGAEKKQLVLNKRLLVFAESNLPDEHLARIVVKLGILPRTKVNEIATLMKNGRTSEEAVLALSNSGMEDLEKARHEQAITILASILSWDDCDLHFYPGESLVRYQLSLNLSLLEALVIAARRATSERSIRIPPGFMQGILVRTLDASGKIPDFPLNEAEAYACSLILEPVKGEDLLPLIPDTGEKPEIILLRLYLLGLIDVQSSSSQVGGKFAGLEPAFAFRILEDMAAGFESASLYDILSIPPEANPEEVQSAYHQLAKQFHPDRFQSKEFSDETRGKAEQVFTLINKAYLALKDPILRADYDEKRLAKESKVEAELKARGTAQSDDEETAEAIYREGRALLNNKDFEKAVEHLKACVWLSPNKPKFNHYLGVAESEIPKLRKSAEQHFLRALELDNTSVASRLELARLYIKVMLRRKAEMQLQELMRWDPHNREVQKLIDQLNKLEKTPKRP